MNKYLAPLLVACLALPLLPAAPARAAGELARGVRLKISAGDLLSAESMAEEYRLKSGADLEYLNALGWLVRGAHLLGHDERALELARQLREAVASPQPDQLTALGAAIEIESRIKAEREGKGAAVAFLDREKRWSEDPAFRSRLMKNVNLLTLEGAPAAEIASDDTLFGPAFAGLKALQGRPVVLFFWAHWCGDCRDQAGALARVKADYEKKGVVFLSVTRYYGTGAEGADIDRAEEKKHVQSVLNESYANLGALPVIFSQDAMIRYGASATPTFAFLDRQGKVASYTPTRLAEAELRRRIDATLKP